MSTDILTQKMREAMRRWPAANREEWLERAAICEYDAGMDRDEAERFAYDVLEERRQRVITYNFALRKMSNFKRLMRLLRDGGVQDSDL